MKQTKIKLTRDGVEFLSLWILNTVPSYGSPDSLRDCATSFLMLELRQRLEIWLVTPRNPKRAHGISIRHSECAALLSYIYRATEPKDSSTYMSLHQIKAEIERVLFVKGNVNMKVYA